MTEQSICGRMGKFCGKCRSSSSSAILFPRFETYREQIDKYWFPTYTKAVDTLQFSTGAKRIREIIKYENYKKFEADVKLTFGDTVEGGGAPDQAPSVSSDKKAPALDPRLNDPKAKKK